MRTHHPAEPDESVDWPVGAEFRPFGAGVGMLLG